MKIFETKGNNWMPNNSLNLLYFFVSLILLSLLWFNISYWSSSVIGSLTLLMYIIMVASWIGRLGGTCIQTRSKKVFS